MNYELSGLQVMGGIYTLITRQESLIEEATNALDRVGFHMDSKERKYWTTQRRKARKALKELLNFKTTP